MLPGRLTAPPTPLQRCSLDLHRCMLTHLFLCWQAWSSTEPTWDPMFAAGDANDGELTSEIYEHHGGNDAPNLKQSHRRITPRRDRISEAALGLSALAATALPPHTASMPRPKKGTRRSKLTFLFIGDRLIPSGFVKFSEIERGIFSGFGLKVKIDKFRAVLRSGIQCRIDTFF